MSGPYCCTAGLQGLTIGCAFEGASGSVDGQTNAGVLDTPTGANGCTIASVTSTGVTPGGDTTPRVRFFFGALSVTVDILAGQLILQAIPSSVFGDGLFTITLRLIDSGGNPVAGVQLTGECESGGATLGIVQQPGVTNAQGTTTATVRAEGFLTFGETPPTGTCTFTTATGEPEATVTFNGLDACEAGTSPLPPDCPGQTTNTLTVNLVNNVGAGVNPPPGTPLSLTSGPTGITCTAPAGGTQTCTGNFAQGTNVTLQTTAPVTWSGDCATDTSITASVAMSGPRTCTATRQ
jgi:hypothetical protein